MAIQGPRYARSTMRIHSGFRTHGPGKPSSEVAPAKTLLLSTKRNVFIDGLEHDANALAFESLARNRVEVDRVSMNSAGQGSHRTAQLARALGVRRRLPRLARSRGTERHTLLRGFRRCRGAFPLSLFHESLLDFAPSISRCPSARTMRLRCFAASRLRGSAAPRRPTECVLGLRTPGFTQNR